MSVSQAKNTSVVDLGLDEGSVVKVAKKSKKEERMRRGREEERKGDQCLDSNESWWGIGMNRDPGFTR